MRNHALLQTAAPAACPSPVPPHTPDQDRVGEAMLLRIARRADELARASEPRPHHLSDRWFWMKAEREVLGARTTIGALNLLRLCARWTQGPVVAPGETCRA